MAHPIIAASADRGSLIPNRMGLVLEIPCAHERQRPEARRPLAGGQSRPNPHGGSITWRSARSLSEIAFSAAASALSGMLGGSASSRRVYCASVNSAMASRQRRGSPTMTGRAARANGRRTSHVRGYGVDRQVAWWRWSNCARSVGRTPRTAVQRRSATAASGSSAGSAQSVPLLAFVVALPAAGLGLFTRKFAVPSVTDFPSRKPARYRVASDEPGALALLELRPGDETRVCSRR
jgi:hypothetical protein